MEAKLRPNYQINIQFEHVGKEYLLDNNNILTFEYFELNANNSNVKYYFTVKNISKDNTQLLELKPGEFYWFHDEIHYTKIQKV